MIDPKFFENLAKQLASLVPTDLHSLREDMEKNFRTTLQAMFSKLDLVTHVEFDVQVKLLEKTRERVALLEEKIRAQENNESI